MASTRPAPGFWLGQRFQSRGLGAQMRAAALHLAFVCLGAERVTSTAFAENAASRRVSEKFGYTPNGVRRRRRQPPGGGTPGSHHHRAVARTTPTAHPRYEPRRRTATPQEVAEPS
ncbi:GNAT family N-acetyltransferase [Streptomyces chattanoogensis]|uniref:GNAT family N-acetyltransferase n=1 Tax=Streptomyces chattanoogensis TaxID=66876 RepID=UPI003688D611